MTLSRRDVVLSTAASVALFGIDKRVVLIGDAQAQEASDAGTASFRVFQVGDMRVTTVYDGIWQKPHDAGFIKNATVEDTKKALKDGGLTDAHVPITFTVTVVETAGKTIMFDAGTGGQLSPAAGKLSKNLGLAGIDPTKIDTVIVTHFHPDHIFGLMAKDDNAQVYAKAEIIVPAAEIAWWTDAGVFTKLPEERHGLAKRIQATLGKWQNVTQVEGEKEVAPGIVALPSPGHTAGHTVFVLGSGNDELMVLADTSNIPALFVKNPGWHAAFDADPQLAETNRRKMFDRAIADKAIITGYHYGMPGAGRLAKDGTGYAFTPLA